MPLTTRQRKERLGRKQKDVADSLGLSRTTVNLVVNGKTQLLGKDTVAKVRAAIAERIGEPVEVVFGKVA